MPLVSDVTTRLGRVQLVVGTPQMSPGKCVICGTSGNKETQFIDTGWDIDFYGVVYFCMDCIKEAAAVLSMVPTEKLSEALETLGQEQFMREALQEENEGLRDVISRLTSSGFSIGDSRSDSDSSEFVVDETAEGSTKESERVSKKSPPAKSRSAKQINESGSTNVRVDDSPKADSIIADL